MGDFHAEVVKRLQEGESEQDEAARKGAARARLDRPIIDTAIHSDYIMYVRFNEVVKLIARKFGLAGKTVLGCGCGGALYEIALAKHGAAVWAYDLSGNSSLNIYHKFQTDHEAAWTQEAYRNYLRTVFGNVEFLCPLNALSGLQKILKKVLLYKAVDTFSQYAVTTDNALGQVAGLRWLTWHTVIFAYN